MEDHPLRKRILDRLKTYSDDNIGPDEFTSQQARKSLGLSRWSTDARMAELVEQGLFTMRRLGRGGRKIFKPTQKWLDENSDLAQA